MAVTAPRRLRGRAAPAHDSGAAVLGAELRDPRYQAFALCLASVYDDPASPR